MVSFFCNLDESAPNLFLHLCETFGAQGMDSDGRAEWLVRCCVGHDHLPLVGLLLSWSGSACTRSVSPTVNKVSRTRPQPKQPMPELRRSKPRSVSAFGNTDGPVRSRSRRLCRRPKKAALVAPVGAIGSVHSIHRACQEAPREIRWSCRRPKAERARLTAEWAEGQGRLERAERLSTNVPTSNGIIVPPPHPSNHRGVNPSKHPWALLVGRRRSRDGLGLPRDVQHDVVCEDSGQVRRTRGLQDFAFCCESVEPSPHCRGISRCDRQESFEVMSRARVDSEIGSIISTRSGRV